MFYNPSFPDHITAPNQDTRNVIDHYKGWDNILIKNDLQSKAFPTVVVLENFAHDFNIATAIRNCNAFGVKTVYVLGRGSWDSRGTVGTQHYMDIRRIKEIGSLYDDLREEGYVTVAIDNVEGAVTLNQASVLPTLSCFVFGQESIGVSNLTLAQADWALEVPMYGSVRSLNVGTTSGIVLNHWCMNHASKSV